MQNRLSYLSGTAVFFDFDNTITHFDVLDDIIKRFSIDKEWVKFEKAWQKGEIGSRVCLKNQLKSVRIDKDGLLRYLSEVRIDPAFPVLCKILKTAGVSPVILSDNFDFIIENILENNYIGTEDDVKIYANGLRFCRDRLIPLFPHSNRRCVVCGHCKKKNLIKETPGDRIIIYIGDGLSDICPAEHSDIVFAKAGLLRHCRDKKRFCLPFKKLSDVQAGLTAFL